MPLSNIQQIQTPDPSGVAVLLRGANLSFNNAFDAANGVLGQYQEGQTAKADAQFVNDIANVKNEDELNKLLGSGAHLANPNMSPEMLKTALALRDTVLGYDSTRINQTNTRDSNSRANAQEGRTQADWVYGNNARDAMTAMTPILGAAYANGLTYGQPAGPGGGSPAAGGDRAAYLTNELVRRGVPTHVASGVIMNGIDESGLNPAAIGDNGNAGGLFQWNGPRFQGLQAFARDQGRDWKDEQVQLDYFMAENAGSQKDNWAKVVGSRNASEAAVNFLNHWERPAEQYRAERANKYSGWTGGATPGPTGFSGGQYNAYMQSPAMTAALAAMAQNPYLTPDQFKSLTDVLNGSTEKGQATINARDAEEQALLIASAQNASVLNPNNVTPGQMQAQAVQTPGLNPISAQKAAGGIATLAAPGGALDAVGIPATTPDPLVQAAVDQQNAADATALSTSPEARKNDVLKKFTAAEDPVQALVDQANESGGGTFFDTVELTDDTRKAVQTLADAAGVSVPQMAATLADITDPSTEQRGWGLNNRPSLNNLLGAVQDGGLGALREFFNDPTGQKVDMIVKAAKEDAALAKGYDSKSTANTKSAADRELAKTQVDRLTAEIAKRSLIDPADPQISVLQGQLQKAKQGLFNNASPLQDAISRVKMYSPGSPDWQREMQSVKEQIMADPNITDKAAALKAAGIMK